MTPAANCDTRSRRIARRRTALIVPVVVAAALLASSCVLNGTWAVAAPASVGPLPAGTDPAFVDVACADATFCMGVGNADPATPANALPFIQTWDGASWSHLEFVVALPPETIGIELRSVSCGTPTSCGVLWDWHVPGDVVARFSLWDGSSFTTVPLTGPGAQREFSAVACSTDASCLFAVPGANPVSSVGTTFPTLSFPAPPIASLQCLSRLQCAGFDGTGRAVRMESGTWSLRGTAPTPPAGAVDQWRDMACTSLDECIAVGTRTLGANPTDTVPIAARVYQGGWSLRMLPTTDPGGLRAISCAERSACVAVGWTVPAGSGTPTETAYAWPGQDWYAVEAPPAPAGGTYDAVSCATPGVSCVAVGAAPAEPLAATYTWVNG